MTEENPRELDKRLRNQIQNLLESKEGRNLFKTSQDDEQESSNERANEE